MLISVGGKNKQKHIFKIFIAFKGFSLQVVVCILKKLHCKKRLPIFPSPARMSPTKLSLAGNS
jgi:hypothetical protein